MVGPHSPTDEVEVLNELLKALYKSPISYTHDNHGFYVLISVRQIHTNTYNPGPTEMLCNMKIVN